MEDPNAERLKVLSTGYLIQRATKERDLDHHPP